MISSNNVEDVILGYRIAYDTVDPKNWHLLSLDNDRAVNRMRYCIKLPNAWIWIGWYGSKISSKCPVDLEDFINNIKGSQVEYLEF